MRVSAYYHVDAARLGGELFVERQADVIYCDDCVGARSAQLADVSFRDRGEIRVNIEALGEAHHRLELRRHEAEYSELHSAALDYRALCEPAPDGLLVLKFYVRGEDWEFQLWPELRKRLHAAVKVVVAEHSRVEAEQRERAVLRFAGRQSALEAEHHVARFKEEDRSARPGLDFRALLAHQFERARHAARVNDGLPSLFVRHGLAVWQYIAVRVVYHQYVEPLFRGGRRKRGEQREQQRREQFFRKIRFQVRPSFRRGSAPILPEPRAVDLERLQHLYLTSCLG